MFLSFIPILGPIIDGVFGLIGNQQKLNLAKIQDQAERIKLQHELTLKARDSASIRLATDIATFPVVIWMAIGTWDTIVAKRFPDWRFLVADFPEGTALQYLPFAVLALLFGNAWLVKR